MRTVIAGGHGKIALLLEQLLAERGNQVVGLIRNLAQVADVQNAGAQAVICDLEAASANDVAVLLSGADAVVFAAGAGPGSGAPRKDSVDRAASVLMADAAERAGVRRFVQVSAMGAGQPLRSGSDEVWAAYITAKTAAEADLRARDLDWTILRPGGLTDAPATGKIRLAPPPVPRGTIPRADVAAVIAALLDSPGTRHQTLELTGGDSPVAAAVHSISLLRRRDRATHITPVRAPAAGLRYSGGLMPVRNHDGADLFYQVEGKGPPLLLIMGLGYPSDMWWRMLPWLTPHFTTVRFDNRGVGRTGPGAERPYSVERMALDARAVLHAAGFARSTVFGVSMGGTIAQELALSHPKAVDRLVLGCSHPGGADVVLDEEVLTLLARRGEMTPQEAAEASIPFVYAPGTPRADIDADLAVRAAHPTDPDGYTAQLTDTLAWRGSLDRLPGLAIPTLLIHGNLDRLVPIENSRRMAAVLPSARLEVLAGASHIFATDQPERTRTVLESFLIHHQ